MATNVVRATLLADAKGFKKGFQEAEQTTKGFESKASTVSKAVKGFFALQAVQAVKAFADDSVRAFSEVEQSIGSVESVFGTAAGEITTAAKTAAQQFGLSASDFNESAALIGAQLKNQLGLSADEAAGKTQELIGKASDLAATFGGTTSDAISAIGSLLRGERDPIEKYGISMNDAMISAHALETGLADTAGEIDANAKASAALDLLFAQSADSAGQFAREADTLAGATQRANAQLENNKALVGQAIAGAYRDIGIPVMSAFGDALGDVALAWMELTGEMSVAEVVMQRMGEDFAAAGSPVEQLTVAIQEQIKQINHWDHAGEEFQTVVNDLTAGLGLEADELANLLDLLPQVAREQGLTKEATNAWRQALERAIAIERQKQVDLGRGRGREQEYAAALQNTEDHQRGATDAVYDNIAAMEAHRNKTREQMDPLFAYAEANRRVTEAQKNVTKAQEEFGRGSPEHIEALDALRAAGYDVRDAELAMARGMGTSRKDMESHLRSLRVYTEDQIQAILDDMERINAFQFRSKVVSITHRVTGGGVQEYDTGGVVAGPRGQAQLAVVHGGETILPTHKGGRRGLVAAAGVTMIFNISSLSPQDSARAVIQAIQTYERTNGSHWRKGS